jgi:Zn-finger nucleic acid-binding protein
MKSIHIPEIKSYYKNNELLCTHCAGKMMTGVQYYAMKRSWIDLTCIVCARGVDIEVGELNRILTEFNFKPIKERYVASGQNN